MKASKEQCLGHLSRIPLADAMKALKTTERGIKLILNTRRISQENMDLLVADMIKRGIKVLDTAPVAPNAIIAQPETPQGPQEEGGIEAEEQPQPTTATEAADMQEIPASKDIRHGRQPEVSPVVINQQASNPKLMMCCPVGGRNGLPISVVTCFTELLLAEREKVLWAYLANQPIVKARNLLAHTFLGTGCEWSFWMDDDMLVPFGREDKFWSVTGLTKEKFPADVAAQNTILRLVYSARQKQSKIMSGLYFGRSSHGRVMHGSGIQNREVDQISRHSAGKDVVSEVEWCATGCLLVHRDVFLAIRQRNPSESKVYPFFNEATDGLGGEDRAFGIKARAAGFRSYVDHKALCGHIGFEAYTHKNTAWGPSAR